MRLKKNKFRILLVSLYNDEAYGLRILHSILVNNGFDCKMCFFKLSPKSDNSGYTSITEKEIRLFKDAVCAFNPGLIGFSLVSTGFSAYKRIYDHIADYKIIMGGWHASLMPEETIGYCNMLCIGEGEEPMLEVADSIYKGISPAGVKNIWVNNNGSIVKNKTRPLIPQIDYPPLKFEDTHSFYINDEKVVSKDPYKINTRYGTMISRGCPYRCTYCSNSYMVKNVYKNWSAIRYRRSGHVIDELLEVKKSLKNVNRINFYDEVFLFKKAWAREFFSKFKSLVQLPFYCMFYPGSCSDENAEMLKGAGLAGVWLGVQSGSERVRREVFNRLYTNEAILRQANIFQKHGISVRYDFIFDNPFETDEESRETIELMKSLPKPCSFNMFSLKYFPNTEITKMALERKIIGKRDIEDQLKNDYQYYLVGREKEEALLDLIGR